MNISIEVCVKEGTTTTEKGQILEKLTANALNIQQFAVYKTLRVTGMEIDVLAKHKINNTIILVECKACESALSADVISKLLGNIELRNATAGWLLTTGPLSKDAEGIRCEWENRTDLTRSKLSFYTADRIIDLLLSSRLIIDAEIIREKIKTVFTTSENVTLMISDIGMFWIIPILEKNSNFISSIVVFDAQKGERVEDKAFLDDLKARKNSYSEYEWVGGKETDVKVVEQLLDEYRNIVPVISGDDWSDYRPARPDDFVGRKAILNDIFTYFNSVINNISLTRLFSIKAPSGMGKSSIILKTSSMAQSRRKSKRYFVYAVDVRTAMSSRYAEMALKSCFDAADNAGFTDTKQRNLEFSNISQFIQSDSVIQTFSYLKKENRLLVLIFDQFEELFSKKELFGLFDNIKLLSNIIDSQKQNFVLGFAWKTDLSIPAEHPAYYMWSNLSDRRKEFEVSQFKQPEIKSALSVFGKQLGEKINPVLASYLSKQCQGYPWLLKKLCIHVFGLITQGSTQDAVIGKKLNIVDLFDRDLAELTSEEHSCILEIAKETPADFFKIDDLYGNVVIQSLINRRVVVRRASKLTLYWDIFRDYVLNKTIPTIVLDYIPQQLFVSFAKILSILLECGSLQTQILSQKAGLNTKTIDNFMIDAVMFGVAKRENGIISLTVSHENELIEILQSFFKNHILFIQLSKIKNYFDYNIFTTMFNSIYEQSDISVTTRAIYISKIYSWFVYLDLIFEQEGKFYTKSINNTNIVLKDIKPTRIRGNKYLTNSNNLFWGQTSPENVLKTYNQIIAGCTSYRQLKSHGLRNAIEILIMSEGIQKKGDTITIAKSINDIFDYIANSSTICFVKNELEHNADIKNHEIGHKLSIYYSRNWAESSKIRYGNSLLLWTRYILAQMELTH